MKITLNPFDFNKIMEVCSPFTTAKERECLLRCIEIVHKGDGVGFASACDGFAMVQTRFECEGDSGRMLILPHEPVKDYAPISLSYENNRATIDFGSQTVSYTVSPPEQYVDLCKIADYTQSKPKTISMAFDVGLLKKMVKVCNKRNKVYLDIYGQDDAIVFHTEYRAEGLVLPIALHGNKHKTPRFYRGEAGGV